LLSDTLPPVALVDDNVLDDAVWMKVTTRDILKLSGEIKDNTSRFVFMAA
jgi:hypothetical protein